MTAQNKQPKQIVLPEQLTSSVDLSRLIRELEALDESLHQAQLRKPGTPTKLARSSLTLEDLARQNGVSLTDNKQRQQLIELMHGFYAHAPRIHMSFAAEPSANFTRKIVIWLRQHVHPLILVEIGLQPTLAAGCIVRTTNKVFDMSLRHHFTENRHLLVKKIGEVEFDPETPKEAATVQPSAAPSQADQVPSQAPAIPTAAPAPATQHVDKTVAVGAHS